MSFSFTAFGGATEIFGAEDDQSLKHGAPLDLEAELNGYRSLEDVGGEDAATQYFDENFEAVDAELTAKLETGEHRNEELIDQDGSKELEQEISQLIQKPNSDQRL